MAENNADAGFQSDCVVGLAVTPEKVEKGRKRSQGVRGLLLGLLPPPPGTNPTGLRAEQVGRQLGCFCIPPAARPA